MKEIEAATGRQPFHGETPRATLDAIVEQAPPTPRGLNPGVPRELERIILKALEQDRTHRYQSAAELRADLNRLRGALLTRLWPAAMAGAMVFTVLAFVIALRLGWLGQTPAPTLDVTPRQITANPVDDPVLGACISADGKSLAYTDLTGIHIRNIDTGEVRSFAPPPGYCFR